MAASKEVLSPRESGEFIAKNAKHLKILSVDKLAKEILAGILDKSLDKSNFSQSTLHPKSTDKNAVEWIFVVDALNFCFWTPTNYTKYKVNGHTGYFALCAVINRALSEGLDLTDAKVYSEIDAETLANAFRSDDGETKVPLFQKRLQVLHEVGKRLIEKWDGKFENVIKAAEQSSKRLLELIVEEFPCFRDEAGYNGQRLAIYKRAQILIGDLWACFGGENWGKFNDLENITMFADYRIPQVLVHFETLEYSPKLLELLKNDTILENGDPREVEIRGASIYIVEQAKDAVIKELQEKHPDVDTTIVNSILIDHYLWDYRRKHAAELEKIPFHKTLSVYY